MIALDKPAIEAACPQCSAPLLATGWHMPGMRMLARAHCGACGRDYYVDLPAGQGIYSPMILDAATGEVHDRAGVRWFADWLQRSYRQRGADSPPLIVNRLLPVTRPVVLINCLDTVYGHALLKLLNAQQYLDAGSLDVIVIIQPFLAPLVPDGVAETWLLDLSLAEGTSWSDGLAEAIKRESARFSGVHLAPVHPHPHPAIVSIKRFSRVSPFRTDQWHSGGKKKVTFIWRDDRQWTPAGRLRARTQQNALKAFFEALREEVPELDAAVAGIGAPGGLPAWIADLRSPIPSESEERDWLERYAKSHAVVGVHGSNMILPSAHAGSTFELLPEHREGNFLQDIVFNGADARDLFFRYRFLPDDIAPSRLARTVVLVLTRYPDFDRLMSSAGSQDSDVRA